MPLHKDATLDLVLTNMHEFYISSLAFPPFGLVTKRDQGPSLKVAMERYVNSIDCPLLFASLGSWEDKWAVFQQAIFTGIDILMSARKVRVCGVPN